MKLNERAMLASLTINRWQATLTDKKITSEIAAKHSVNERRAGKYKKYAIDIEAPSFRAVTAAASDLRHTHYYHTLPWGQDGARILTAVNFDNYSTIMRGKRAVYSAAADAFAHDMPRLQSDAQRDLNGMYNPKDYPRNVRALFDATMTIMPLPDASDFRASLSDDVVSEIRANIEAELAKTTETAMREPYERLFDHITRMVNALSDPKAIFRDTLVTGLDDLCRILPALNLTSDKRLDDLRRKSEALIANVDPQQLREVPSIRADVAKRANEIHDIMSGFMGDNS
jgi:hypothetical protein